MTNPNPKRTTIPAAGDGTLALYRLVPIAEANDPRWDMASFQGEVVVRARSPADARLVAADAEDDYRELKAAPADGKSTASASAFVSIRRRPRLCSALALGGSPIPR